MKYDKSSIEAAIAACESYPDRRLLEQLLNCDDAKTEAAIIKKFTETIKHLLPKKGKSDEHRGSEVSSEV